MTMEEVARGFNLREAFRQVASNHGAPGPDGMTIEEVREHLDEILSRLQSQLLAGTYRPGDTRRVWIPKPDGGQRGLGIPNVIDRIVAQAVAQVMTPHYNPTFHPSSHGFREGRSCHTAIAEAMGYLEEGLRLGRGPGPGKVFRPGSPRPATRPLEAPCWAPFCDL
jgi:retron-type reverse transcriptase